ncbi:MAG TPA: hypothetical protein VFW07_05055 [Parafilimonas sp.]|nr:hypothetical protein [Parafilimonas sp.]
MNTRIIPVKNKEEWNNIIFEAALYDFYHCNSYNCLDKSGEPFLFVAYDSYDFIAFPLIKRSIQETDLHDCTSVYGYAGPIASKAVENLDPRLIIFFQEELNEYLRDNKIVSVFSRLHPLIPQEFYFENFGTVIPINQTVVINTKLSLEKQRQQYRRRFKTTINQVRRKGFMVKRAETKEEINAFANIYKETMYRLNADAYYLDSFDNNYFHDLFKANDFQPQLLLAYLEKDITAGAVFIVTKNFMQYHVAGTKEKYTRDTPMKLIIDEARLLATQLQLVCLHLGGGVGGSDTDSLFHFKSGFSDLTCTFKAWQLIINKKEYNNLVAINSKKRLLNQHYFPLYRG